MFEKGILGFIIMILFDNNVLCIWIIKVFVGVCIKVIVSFFEFFCNFSEDKSF